MIKLAIKDTGIGFPKNVDFRHAETLGFQLITTLVEQLNGTIELFRENGTAFMMTLTRSTNARKL